MTHHYDSSASGYILDSFEGISQTFTDVEILSTSEVNVVAKAKRYGRWWLLKGLRKEVAAEAGYQQRLRKELEILMLLQHPNVVAAYGMEVVEGLGRCIVMEYVDGVTLKEWLAEKPSRRMRIRVMLEIADAVAYVEECRKHVALSERRRLVHGLVGTIHLFVAGLRALPAHHRLALRRQERRRAVGQPERCGLTLHHGTLRVVVRLAVQRVAHADVVVAHHEGHVHALPLGVQQCHVHAPRLVCYVGSLRARHVVLLPHVFRAHLAHRHPTRKIGIVRRQPQPRRHHHSPPVVVNGIHGASLFGINGHRQPPVRRADAVLGQHGCYMAHHHQE